MLYFSEQARWIVVPTSWRVVGCLSCVRPCPLPVRCVSDALCTVFCWEAGDCCRATCAYNSASGGCFSYVPGCAWCPQGSPAAVSLCINNSSHVAACIKDSGWRGAEFFILPAYKSPRPYAAPPCSSSFLPSSLSLLYFARTRGVLCAPSPVAYIARFASYLHLSTSPRSFLLYAILHAH